MKTARTARAVRYEVAWTFPQRSFHTQSNPGRWWVDSSHLTLAQGNRRLYDMEVFATAYAGTVALYEVTYAGTAIVGEKLLSTVGLASNKAPSRRGAQNTTKAVRNAFEGQTFEWKDLGNALVAPVAVRVVVASRPFLDSLSIKCLIGLAAIAGGGAWAIAAVGMPTVAPYAPPADTAAASTMTAEEARFGRIHMRRDNTTTCDTYQYDNRTGQNYVVSSETCAGQRAARQTAKDAGPKQGMWNFNQR